MQRRQFLSTTLSSLAAAGWAAGHHAASDAAALEPELPIVDTHTHFYDPTRPEGVPWPGKGDPRLYRPVLPDEFRKLTAPLGVVGTVVVEASPWVEDNQWLLDLATRHGNVLGVVGNLDPLADDFEKRLRRFVKDTRYRGFRVGHDTVKKGLDGALVERAKLLVDLNLELDVNGGPDMPADVARLAAQLPELRIVINHCGNVKNDGREAPRAWREGMAAAAKHPHVFCKVSALVEQTTQKPAPRDVDYYRPVLDTLWNAFGEDRLVYGSNWPVSDLAAPYTTVLEIVREYFLSKGKAAAKKYFQANAKVAYAWPPPLS